MSRHRTSYTKEQDAFIKECRQNGMSIDSLSRAFSAQFFNISSPTIGRRCTALFKGSTQGLFTVPQWSEEDIAYIGFLRGTGLSLNAVARKFSMERSKSISPPTVSRICTANGFSADVEKDTE